jgi:bacterioferritin-associated ferredoxin
MFICSCNALTDKDIKSQALECDGTVVDCYRLLGTAPVCGTCMSNAKALIDETRADVGSAQPAAMAQDRTGQVTA